MTFDIYRYLPTHYRTKEDTFLRAFLAALSSGHLRLADMVEAAVDQQFLTTATGKYLLYLAEQQGFALPPNSGLDIRALRTLVPIAVANPKQVTETLNKLIEAFYGADKTRTTLIAARPEPYSFQDKDSLIVDTEAGPSTVVFLSAQFSDISNVTAAEVAALINTSQTVFTADVYTDRKTNEKYLRILSGTAGSGSSLRISGGTAQNVLHLPRIVPTLNTTGTSWTASKVATYNDVTTFQWDGVGLNPGLYLVKPGDVVTLRALSSPELNGSFVVQDAGYDYFTVLNPTFQSLSTSFTEATDDDVVFTSQVKSTIYDGSEYALETETEDNTVTITVPAVPPLARRFLAGSAHLHGLELPVLDFTRSSVTVDNDLIDTQPVDQNHIVLANKYFRYDFSMKSTFKLTGSDSLSPRVFTCDSSNDDYGVFPFTNSQPLDDDMISGRLGEDTYTLRFPYAHGLRPRWGFNLTATAGAGNITPTMMNREHTVLAVVDSHTIQFRLHDANNTPVRFSGVSVSGFDVYQWAAPQSHGGDFYLEFSSLAALATSGIEVGSSVKISQSSGINTHTYLGMVVRNRIFEVTSVVGAKASIRTGYGTGSAGLVLQGGSGVRNASFGGNLSYYFDKTSAHNQETVMASLQAVFLDYSPSTNSHFVGSFIFDPQGVAYQNTVTSQLLTSTGEIFRGANPTSIFVESVSDFPTSGKLLIDYGTDRAEGPIDYLATIENDSGDSQVLIDPAYRFQKSHSAGATVWYVGATSPYTPSLTGSDFPAYLTGTAQARNALLEILKMLVASGIFIDFNVLFPDLKYADPSIQPFA